MINITFSLLLCTDLPGVRFLRVIFTEGGKAVGVALRGCSARLGKF